MVITQQVSLNSTTQLKHTVNLWLRGWKECVKPMSVYTPQHVVISYIVNMCFLLLNQEQSNMESKPRMSFYHPDKGNAAASEETLVLENLSKPVLPGEHVNRKRYIEGMGS